MEKDTSQSSTNDRIVRVRLIDGTQVNGQVNIDRAKGYDRLSDLMSDTDEPFLILHHVTIHQSSLDNPIRHKTLFVNKQHVIWAEPDQDQK